MQVCKGYQVSHSHFMGGPRRWTDVDRQMALEYEMYLAALCPRCRTEEAEWQYRDENGRVVRYNPPPYVPEAHRCPGCESTEGAQAELPKENQFGLGIRLAPFEESEDDASFDRGLLW